MKTTSTNYICEKCQKIYKKREQFNSHKQGDRCTLNLLLEKIGDNYKCKGKDCDYMSQYKQSVRRHILKCSYLDDDQINIRDIGIPGSIRDKEMKLKKVYNKKQHMKEYVGYLFSDVIVDKNHPVVRSLPFGCFNEVSKQIDEMNGECIFINFTFNICMSYPLIGIIKLIETIYFNDDYEDKTEQQFASFREDPAENAKLQEDFARKNNAEDDLSTEIGF